MVVEAFNKDLVNKETMEFILIKHPILPTFYSLPKVHKNLQDPPGGPVISDIGSLTSNASLLIEEYLRPHVVSLPSYIKDTIELLKIMYSLQLLANEILVTIDVEAFYSSGIPHGKGVQITGNF